MRTEWQAPSTGGGAPVHLISSDPRRDDGEELRIVLYLWDAQAPARGEAAHGLPAHEGPVR